MEMSSKKRSRLEAKKKKAAAFLQLVKNNQEPLEEEEKHKTESHQVDSDEPPKKKAREMEEGDKEIVINVKNISSTGREHHFQAMASNELETLRKLMRERQKAAMQKPKLFLTLETMATYNSPCGDTSNPQLPPLFLADLQHLILYGLQGNTASFKPRWCRLLRVGQVSGMVVIVVDSVSYLDFDEHAACFPGVARFFDMSVEMVTPAQYGSSVDDDLFRIPISKSQLLKMDIPDSEKKKLKLLLDTNRIQQQRMKNKEKIPCTHLLLNFGQLLQDNYPLPVQIDSSMFNDFVFSSDHYSTVTSHSPLFAIDCEMCMTTAKKSELCRVSVVNEKMEIVYDTLVKPYNKITDYVTRFSGITKFMLDPVTTRIEDVQKRLREIITSDSILCGQSLNGDLIALKIFHPYIIDTSVVYNTTGDRKMKTSLKRLTASFLGRTIQDSADGHCSVEDARAAMELVLLKLKNGLQFGDVILGGAVELGSLSAHNISTESSHAPRGEKYITSTSLDLRQSDSQQTNNNSKNEMNQLKRDHPGDDKDSKETGNTSRQDICDNQKTAFFQRLRNFLSQNFFKLLQESNKTAVVIGNNHAPIGDHVDQSMTRMFNSDKECQKAAKVEIGENDFVYIHLTGFSECLSRNPSVQEKQKALRKLDRRLSKILKHIQSKTVVSVVFSGRKEEEGFENAKTFVKVT